MSNQDHQYHGWCKQYDKNGIETSKFHLWNAQMAILNILYASKQCQLYQDVMYLYLIYGSLSSGKQAIKSDQSFIQYFDILGYFGYIIVSFRGHCKKHQTVFESCWGYPGLSKTFPQGELANAILPFPS